MPDATDKNDKIADVQKKMFAARDAISAYVDAEIALCKEPPNPALIHSSVARFFLYTQVSALKKIDKWMDDEIAKYSSSEGGAK